MNNSGHRYVKTARKTTGPSQLVCVVPVAERWTGHRGNRSRMYYGDKCVACYSRRRGSVWSPPERTGLIRPAELWDWVDARLYDRSRLWIVAPSAGDMLTLLDFWSECDAGRYEVVQQEDARANGPDAKTGRVRPWFGRLVLRGRPDIVSARKGRCGLTVVSLSNYTAAALDRLAKWSGSDVGEPDRAVLESGVVHYTPNQTLEIVQTTFRRLVSEWVAGDFGPWRETVGQLVVSLWRRRFLTTKVCRHADMEASAIETAGLHGGRASCWYFGSVGSGPNPLGIELPKHARSWSLDRTGRVHHLDVSSMYPSILRDEWFPTRLLSVRSDLSVAELSSLAEHRAVIATVRAKTEHAEYPYYSPQRVVYKWPDGGRAVKKRSHDMTGRVVYPLGECELTLAGPELQRLIAEGGVLSVKRAAVYDVGRPFRELCEFLLARRAEARLTGDRFIESWCKELNNSFAGKFAQAGIRWEPVTDGIAGERWGEWKLIDDGPPPRVRWFRSLAGMATERIVGPPGSKLLAAVFAYLTSYGRVLMRGIRERMPERSVISQDTDGLWTTDAGLTTLANDIETGEPVPGRLRLVGSYDLVRFWTPKHYYYDGSWVLSGFSDGFMIRNGTHVEAVSSVNPIRSAPSSAPRLLLETTKRTRIDRIGPSEFVGPDGWAVPCRIADGRPVSVEWGKPRIDYPPPPTSLFDGLPLQ